MYGLWLLRTYKTMNNFSRELREQVFAEQEGICHFYGTSFCRGNEGLSFHHIVENTKANRKKYGNKRIQSRENCVMLCHVDHSQYVHLFHTKKCKLISRWDKEINPPTKER